MLIDERATGPSSQYSCLKTIHVPSVSQESAIFDYTANAEQRASKQPPSRIHLERQQRMTCIVHYFRLTLYQLCTLKKLANDGLQTFSVTLL